MMNAELIDNQQDILLGDRDEAYQEIDEDLNIQRALVE